MHPFTKEHVAIVDKHQSVSIAKSSLESITNVRSSYCILDSVLKTVQEPVDGEVSDILAVPNMIGNVQTQMIYPNKHMNSVWFILVFQVSAYRKCMRSFDRMR